MWCIPEAGSDYVACMEDVLDLYEQPLDPQRPLVCYDEWRRALIGETRLSLPAQPGRRKRIDYEYQRHGVAYLHMLFVPLANKRHIRVTKQHTKKEFAHCMKWLVDEVFPEATLIRVVLDNLATHKPAALYETFSPQEARRILRKLEFHFTPKHGSWLNMAEIEFSVLAGQCLDRRLPDTTTVSSEVAAWEAERNAERAIINWRFTTDKARFKLERLYPS